MADESGYKRRVYVTCVICELRMRPLFSEVEHVRRPICTRCISYYKPRPTYEPDLRIQWDSVNEAVFRTRHKG